MRQSIKHWSLIQASEDHFGINMSLSRSLISTLLITQIFAVSHAELFIAVLLRYLEFKNGNSPQKESISTSQIAQGVVGQTRMNQDVSLNAMQAYIKYKAYCDKKANASKLKEADYINVVQPKADHQWSKILLTELRWIGPYIEKVLRNNN